MRDRCFSIGYSFGVILLPLREIYSNDFCVLLHTFQVYHVLEFLIPCAVGIHIEWNSNFELLKEAGVLWNKLSKHTATPTNSASFWYVCSKSSLISYAKNVILQLKDEDNPEYFVFERILYINMPDLRIKCVEVALSIDTLKRLIWEVTSSE